MSNQFPTARLGRCSVERIVGRCMRRVNEAEAALHALKPHETSLNALDRAVQDVVDAYCELDRKKAECRAGWNVHRSCKPIDEVDLSTDLDRGQGSLFGNECEGMCGL